MYGIDISDWQKKLTDMTAVKDAGVTFAILKLGEYRKDGSFDAHYKRFRSAGLPVGAYIYSHAATAERGLFEAENALQWIEGKELQLPLYLDIEEDEILSHGKAAVMAAAEAFCHRIEAAGYVPGVYASSSPWRTHLDCDLFRSRGWSIWVAEWGSSAPHISDYDLWQTSATGSIGGVTVDTDILANVALIGATVSDSDTGEEPEDRDIAIYSIDSCVRLSRKKNEAVKSYYVMAMQDILRAGGYLKAPADGYFGPKTERGLILFQNTMDLEADGICGPQTWSALLSEDGP